MTLPHLGADAGIQAVRFALCLAAGLVSGIIALLYFRKARPVERALTDFFATVLIGGIFALATEFFLDGRFELYAAVAYALGTAVPPFAKVKIRLATEKRKKKTSRKSKLDATSRATHDK